MLHGNFLSNKHCIMLKSLGKIAVSHISCTIKLKYKGRDLENQRKVILQIVQHMYIASLSPSSI